MVITAALRSAPNTLAFTALIAIGLALTHLFCGKLRFAPIPRSGWLSAAGGVSVAMELTQILTTFADCGFYHRIRMFSSIPHQ